MIYVYTLINSFWRDTEQWVKCYLTGRDLEDWRSEKGERLILFLTLNSTLSDMYTVTLAFFGVCLHSPYSSDGKESACNAGDLGLIPGLGRPSGEGNGNPLQCSCLESPMDRGGW